MTLRHRIAAALALAAVVVAAPLAQRPLRKGYSLFIDPSRRYSVEFPEGWDWTIVEGAGEALSTFIQPKKEAAIVVERFRMKQVLEQDDITDVFGEAEAATLKENQPRATAVNAKVIVQGGKKFVQIDYQRPAAIGAPGKVEDERVRQFSFPVKGNLYRITCFSFVRTFPRYEPTFQWVAESLKSAEQLTSK